MTKTELEELIHGVAGALIYGLYMLRYTDEPAIAAAMLQSMQGKGIKFEAPDGTYEGVSAAQIHARYSKPNDLAISKSNFVFVLRSALLRFCYEAIYEYADDNGQLAALKAEAWFYYARTVRNVVSHGTHSTLNRWSPDLTKLGITTITWRHRTLTTADVGMDVELDLYDAWKMHLDMLDYVQNRLT